ncbi:translation initiation factor IF-2 [Passer domesticus]|uniref:translation initiation factor IF-2 n=1 Tax=Passer domesticus TaxID=48849 RepID=UPI0030FEAB43
MRAADGTLRPGDAGTLALPAASRPCAERAAGAGNGHRTHTHTQKISEFKKKKRKAPGMPEEAGRAARMPHRCCRAGPAPRPPNPLQGSAGEGGGAPGAQRPTAPPEPGCPAGLRAGQPGPHWGTWLAMASPPRRAKDWRRARRGSVRGAGAIAPLLCCWGSRAAAPESRRVRVGAERAGACGSPGAAVSAEQAGSAMPGHGSSHTHPLPWVRVLRKAGSCTS